jgi:pilus assembly protein CpaF
MGFELILPFLRPIEHLILDPTISEIMINPTKRVWIERDGRLEEVPDLRLDDRNLRVAIQNIARILGDDFGDEKPLLDSRLPDGSRVAAALPPCAVDGIALTIRKFGARFYRADELVATGSLTQGALDTIADAIRGRRNVLISGGTGTGKTTLLNAITDFIPDEERVILLEDTAELQINKPNLLRFEARREQPPLVAVTIRDLVRATLRHRPDRVILGEVRGGEAFDLLQVLNVGHSGLTTVHANSAAQALTRLANCVLMSDVALPYQAIRAALAETVHLIVHVERRGARRAVRELVRVSHYHPDTDQYALEVLYQSDAQRSTDSGSEDRTIAATEHRL